MTGRPATPSYTIDYVNEQTNEAVPSTDEYATSPDMSGAVAGSGSAVAITPGENLYLRTSATSSVFSSGIHTLDVPSRPVITSSEGGTTRNDPFPATVTFSQAATNLSTAGISATNGTVEGLQLTSASGTSTVYQATIAPLAPGTISLQVLANAVDEGNFLSDLFNMIFQTEPIDYNVDYALEQTLEKISTSDQWSLDNSTWTDGNNDYLSLTPGQDVYFRKKADHTNTQTLWVKARPDIPEFTIDYSNERTAQTVSSGYKYSTSSDMSDAVDGSGDHVTLNPGNNMHFQKWWTWSAFRSEIQTLPVPGRPATPSYTVDYVNEQTSEAVPSTDEYATSPDMSGAVTGSGSTVVVTPGENLYLRTRATASAFSSGIHTLIVPGRPAAPSYTIDYVNEQTNEAVPSTDESATSPDMSGALAGSGSAVAVTPGENLYLRTRATSSVFSSGIQSLDVPERPVITSSEGTTTGNDPFTAFVDFYQFATNLTTAGISVTNGTVEGLQLTSAGETSTVYQASVSPIAEGVVSLQVQADAVDEGNFISGLFNINYEIGAVIDPPDYSVDYELEQTQERISTGDQWSLDNAAWTDGNNDYLSLNPGEDVYFRKKADHSKMQTLDVIERPDTPAFTIDYANERTTGTVSSDYQYSASSDMSAAVEGTGSHVDLTPGNDIYFQTRWTSASFRSEIQTLSVPGRSATPSYTIDYVNEQTSEAVLSTDEYATSPDMSGAVTGSGSTVVVTPGENLYLRTRATTSMFSSGIQALPIPGRPATPSYTIDYVNEQTNEAVPSTDEYATSPDMSGAVTGSGSTVVVTPGENLYLRTRATASTFNSGFQALVVPDRPVITSEEGETTGNDPFTASVAFSQAATNLTTTGILATNGTVEGLQLTSSGETSTVYQATVSPLAEGTISMQVLSNAVTEGNFTSESFSIAYELGTGREDQSVDQMTLYPNPTTGKIRITSTLLGQSGLILGVYSLTGKLVHTEQPAKDQTEVQLDLGHLAHGVYMLKLSSASVVITRKVIIQGY